MGQATQSQWESQQGAPLSRPRGNSSPVNPTRFSPNMPMSSLQMQLPARNDVQPTYGFSMREAAPSSQSNSLGLEIPFGSLNLQSTAATNLPRPNEGSSQTRFDRFEDPSNLHRRRHHSSGYTPLSLTGFTSPAFMRSGSSLTPDGTRYAPRLSSPLSSDVTPTTTKRRSYF